MEKKIVDYTECVIGTVKAFGESRVLLVSTGKDRKPNAMAIGWGTIGVIWSRSVFIVLVRPSRYTFDLIQETGDFTVNVAPASLKETVIYCGTVSGRTHDKFKEKNLTALPSKHVTSPIIKECMLHFECRVIHRNDLIPSEISPEIITEAYPKNDFHRVFFGHILSCSRNV
jgi:flavin reductase (DIM6/NTAB) family NADH-FMN oxidoreductase RutF